MDFNLNDKADFKNKFQTNRTFRDTAQAALKDAITRALNAKVGEMIYNSLLTNDGPAVWPFTPPGRRLLQSESSASVPIKMQGSQAQMEVLAAQVNSPGFNDKFSESMQEEGLPLTGSASAVSSGGAALYVAPVYTPSESVIASHNMPRPYGKAE
jgi:hypothetical protein